MTNVHTVGPPHAVHRREFLRRGGVGLGAIALMHLLGRDVSAERRQPSATARIKDVIFLFMAGGPSQFELFEPKETLQRSTVRLRLPA